MAMTSIQKSTYVEPILFGFMLTTLVLNPTLQQLVYDKVCLEHWNETYCHLLSHTSNETFKNDQSIVQQETASWLKYISISSSLLSIFPTIMYGSWSDKLGRKPVMWLPLIGNLLRNVGLVFVSYFKRTPVYYIIIFAAVTSLFGGFATIIASTMSYVADITTKETRTRRVVILESMLYVSGAIASIGSGYILQYFGYVALYSTVVGVTTLIIIYMVFLKESYRPEKKATWQDLFVVRHFIEGIQVFTRKRVEKCRSTLIIVTAAFTVNFALIMGFGDTLVLYVKHAPRNFDAEHIGFILSESFTLRFLGSLFLSFLFSRVFKWSEYTVIMIGILGYTTYSIILSFADTPLQCYIATLCTILCGLSMPYLRSVMSKMVSTDEKGKMFSVAAALEVLTETVMGVASYKIYEVTEAVTPAFFFYCMAVLTAIPLALVIYLKYRGQMTPFEALYEDDDSKIQR